MIIQNGTIEVQMTIDGGIDEDKGFPQIPGEKWGKPIPCQYSIAKYNALAQILSEAVTEQKYSILIEMQPFSATRVRLKNLQGVEIGQFSVTSIEPLETVDQIRIQV